MIPNQIMPMLQQLKANPVQFLLQQKMNLPMGMAMDNPQAILNHLVQSGQVSQQAVNNAYQIMQNFKN